MVKSLYVGNLPYQTREEDVRALFAQFDPQDVRVIPDKGFGFVDVPDDRAAEAIEALNGTEFQGRDLTVNEARPRPERTGAGGRGGFGGNRGGYGGGGRGYASRERL